MINFHYQKIIDLLSNSEGEMWGNTATSFPQYWKEIL